MPRKKGVPLKTDVRKNKGRPTAYKPEYCEMLIAHMAGGESFPSFGAVIRTHWDCLYDWCNPEMDTYQPEFSEAKKIGEVLLLRWDERMGNLGTYGKLPSFGQSAHIFKMKNRYSKMYKDRTEQIVTDADGNAIQPTQVFVNLPDNGRDKK